MFNCIINFFFTTPCHSRTGANAFNDGFNALMATSKRTWSFPLPVQPCAIPTEFVFSAISTNF